MRKTFLLICVGVLLLSASAYAGEARHLRFPDAPIVLMLTAVIIRCRSSPFTACRVNGSWKTRGVEPDIVIENLPGRMAKGYDDQLDAAIEYVMRKLEEDPKTLPPKPGPPAER